MESKGGTKPHKAGVRQRKRGADRGMAAEVDLRGGGKIPDLKQILPRLFDKRRFGIAQLRRCFAHGFFSRKICSPIQDHDAGRVPPEQGVGKRVNNVKFHLKPPSYLHPLTRFAVFRRMILFHQIIIRAGLPRKRAHINLLSRIR